LVKMARSALAEKHGRDIVVLDVREVSDITDYFVIATGTNRPQIKALCEEVEHVLGAAGVRSLRRSGTPESEWMVVDYLDVIVHIFSPQTRRYYALEELWKDGRRVEE